LKGVESPFLKKKEISSQCPFFHLFRIEWFSALRKRIFGFLFNSFGFFYFRCFGCFLGRAVRTSVWRVCSLLSVDFEWLE